MTAERARLERLQDAWRVLPAADRLAIAHKMCAGRFVEITEERKRRPVTACDLVEWLDSSITTVLRSAAGASSTP